MCQREKEDFHWFDGGPPLSFVPVPVADPNRSWGGICSTCTGHCNGHYLQFPNNTTGRKCFPPRDIIEDAFKTLERPDGVFREESVEELARANLLSTDDVKMWLEHLESVEQRRLCGARRAQTTRMAKKQAAEQRVQTVNMVTVPADSDGDDEAEDDFCLCHQGEYGKMIGCDNAECEQEWFHYECVGIRRKPRGSWYCPNCRQH